jgi:ABC-type transporter Mla subunit MlaD
MMRLLVLGTFAAAVTMAQSAPAPTLASLAQKVRQKAAQWDALAQGLDASIGRLLPCDPKGPAAIEDVSRASDARLAALADYLQAAAQQAARDTDAATRALASSATLISVLEAEKNEIAQEQAGADGEFANLVESAKTRASLDPLKDAFQEVRSELQKRADLIQQAEIGGQESLAPALRDLVTAAEAREAAGKDVQVAYEAERARWKAYYAARLARAQIECSAIKGTAPARPASKGKQP